jgi:lipoprotein-anchoring transpeptidase ErfK/SrfK
VLAHIGPLTSWSHEPQTLLVLGSRMARGHDWLRLLLGLRPDGSNGWVRRDAVVLGMTPYWVDVDKTRHMVTVRRNGRLVLTAEAVIGKAATPTPDGIAAIYERNRQPSPNDFLGTWSLPLTVFSNTLFNFGGGPGRIAIHGRGGASLLDPLGSSASHGCIRIDNWAIRWMASHLGPGTPVDITG